MAEEKSGKKKDKQQEYEEVSNELAEQERILADCKKVTKWVVFMVVWDVPVGWGINLLQAGTSGTLIALPIAVVLFIVETPTTWTLATILKMKVAKVVPDSPVMTTVIVQVIETIPVVEALPVNSVNALTDYAQVRGVQKLAKVKIKSLSKKKSKLEKNARIKRVINQWVGEDPSIATPHSAESIAGNYYDDDQKLDRAA